MEQENKFDSPEKEPEKKETNIRKTSGKEIRSHLWAFLLVAFGVLLYVAINNLGAISSALLTLITILRPIFIGGIIALVLNTPMVAIGQLLSWISKTLFHRKKTQNKAPGRAVEIISLILTILLTLLLIYIVVYSVVPQLVLSASEILSKAQSNLPKYLELLNKLEAYGINTENLEKWLTSLDFTSLLTKLTDNAGNIINTVISSASSIISGAFTAVTSVIFAVYLLANKRWLSCQMKKLGYAYLKKTTVERMTELGKVTSETFSSFISGQCLDAVILGLMCFIAMALFDFPYALATSAMITVTAIIPYIGAFLGGAFGVLLMIIDNPLQALWFVILFIVVQQIDNHVVYPRVVGGSVGLPAIWTFAAVIIGGALFGVVGMVLFIPFFSVIYTLICKTVNRRLEARGITVEEDAVTQAQATPKEKKPLPSLRKIFSGFAEKVFELFKKNGRKNIKKNK